jgi:hypothetical protein
VSALPGGGDFLSRLAVVLREEGGLPPGSVVEPADGAERRFGALASAGPRAASRAAEYALLVEAIREGYLLHYSAGRVVAPGDRDLALLAGDRLYALGLARLAALGDLLAVAELADVIGLAAQAHTAGDPDLAEAAWEAGAAAVGWGTSPAHERAKSAARAGDAEAARALRAVARQLAEAPVRGS